MATISEQFGELWNKLRSSPRVLPSEVVIPVDHVDPPEPALQDPLIPNKSYFQIRMNEMFLAKKRSWHQTIEPMVLFVTEFIYDKNKETVPFVLGPSPKADSQAQVEEGTVYRDIRVAGLHPYRGGRLGISVVFSSVATQNKAHNMLAVLEGAAKALDFSTALVSYQKVASVVLNGVESMLGFSETTPIASLRREYDPDAGDYVRPGYFALIDQPGIRGDTLWLRNHQLYQGNTLAESKPFRDADYIVFSLVQPPAQQRSDLSLLPFYTIWERARKEALAASQEGWMSAKANMLSLYQTMVLSPDMIESQVNTVFDEWKTLLKASHEQAKVTHDLSDEMADDGLSSGTRSRSVEILDL